ncbi:hypothetical protein MBLNU13_g04047t1 [Cladosporium sp. NU13]
MRLINIFPVVAQLAQLAYAQETSVATNKQGSWNALSVLLAALNTFPHLPRNSTSKTNSSTTTTTTAISTSKTYSSTTNTTTTSTYTPPQVPPTPSTVTIYSTVLKQSAMTRRNGFSNATACAEATTLSITSATQPSVAESYDLRTFPTDIPIVTLIQGGPAPALTVTDSSQNSSFSSTTSAPIVWVTETASADETSSEMQAYSGNTLTWSKTFSNTTSGSGGRAASETGATTIRTGPGITGCGASMTVSPTTPITNGIDSAIRPGNTGDPAGMTTSTSTASVAASATSTVTLTGTALVIPVQANSTQPIDVPDTSTLPYEDNTAAETMTSPIDSSSDDAGGIQTTMPIESIQPAITAVTAYDSVHIPHGHPPLITGGQDHKNWTTSTSTSCTDSNTLEASPTVPTPSSFITTTASRVFIGYPPSLSGHNNGTSANTSTNFQEIFTTTELATPLAATHIEIPPPPTVPLDSCASRIWGRPGCLSTPTSFFDAASIQTSQQAQNSTTATVAPVVPAITETQALSTSTNSTTQPAQAQCTSTFYSLPTDACTSTVYASKQSVTINCFGCVGHHALPFIAPDGDSSCQTSTTITEPYTTRTMCGFPDASTASGSFVTSVTSNSSTEASTSQTPTMVLTTVPPVAGFTFVCAPPRSDGVISCS